MSELSVFRSFLPSIQDIEAIEAQALKLPQVACDVIHRFAPGIYIREVFIPAGTFAIGHKQRFDHLNVFLKGKVLIVKEDRSTELLTAPMSFTGRPGRKVGYILEDMYWQNIYATDERDIEKLEELFFEKDASFKAHESEEFIAQSLFLSEDREDYVAMVAEMGMTPDQVSAQVHNLADQIDFPESSYKLSILSSPLHGKGLFASAAIAEGEVIAPARINGKRTPAGRYTNHSKTPNCVMRKTPLGDIELIAKKAIKGYHGGMPGDELTVDYRQAINECYETSRITLCQPLPPQL